jgi:hypothetical protein
MASGANTARMPAVQSSDQAMVCPGGRSSSSAQTASDSRVTGLILTQACNQPGNLSVGTNTLLPKVGISGAGSAPARLPLPWRLPAPDDQPG